MVSLLYASDARRLAEKMREINVTKEQVIQIVFDGNGLVLFFEVDGENN